LLWLYSFSNFANWQQEVLQYKKYKQAAKRARRQEENQLARSPQATKHNFSCTRGYWREMVNLTTFEGILELICEDEADIKEYEQERQLATNGDMRIAENRLITAIQESLAILYPMLYQHPGNQTIADTIFVFPSMPFHQSCDPSINIVTQTSGILRQYSRRTSTNIRRD
jgi:hypothetical protein